MAPSDYLFTGLKKEMKVCHFSSDAEVIAGRITDNLLNFFEWLAKVRATGY